MAIRSNGRQIATMPNELKSFNNRERRWLLKYLCSCGANLNFEAYGPQDRQDQLIANFIYGAQNPHQFIQEIIRIKNENLVSSTELQWIEENPRVSTWMFFHLLNFQFALPLYSAVPQSKIYDEIVLSLDTRPISLDQKIILIRNAKHQWAIGFTPNRLTRWIDPKNHEQLEWAWEYLIKKYSALSIPNPVTPEELHVGVLASFDHLFIQPTNPADKLLFIDRMKKAWKQIEYRASESARKTYNMPLKKSTIGMLNKLAAIDDVKGYEIVDALIREAYEKREGESYPPPKSG